MLYDKSSIDKHITMDTLIDFHVNNDLELPKKITKDDNNIMVMTYNVNSWQNFNTKINAIDNYKTIRKLLSKYEFDVIVLQNVLADSKLPLSKLISDFSSDGYKHYAYVPCGITKNGKDGIYLF